MLLISLPRTTSFCFSVSPCLWFTYSLFLSPSLARSCSVSGQQNCSSHVRRAVVTCFSAGCCGRHGNRPVRYCKRCHVNHHSNEVGASAETHLYQTSPPPINTRECGAEELVCTVESVIRYPSCLQWPAFSLKLYDAYGICIITHFYVTQNHYILISFKKIVQSWISGIKLVFLIKQISSML